MLNVLMAMRESCAKSVHVMHVVQCLVGNANHIVNAGYEIRFYLIIIAT